jgi:SAM-dependent methyltransferase
MSQASELPGNAAQIEYWNAAAGDTWARLQELLDRQIAPLGHEALRALAPVDGEHIIDIGCGCGETSVDLAVRVGATGHVVGVDISKPMLGVARRRPLPPGVARPEFREVDAQTGDLGLRIFDAAYSRFGVMFFSDPIAAFRNIRASMKERGRLAFVCWRGLAENGWMREPLEAASPFLPPSAPSDPTAPGPFAFADAGRLRTILADAGFESVSVDPFDTRIGAGDLDQALKLALRVGPLGSAIREYPDLQFTVMDAVREALSRHMTADGVSMPAAVWIVRAA